MYYFYNCTGHFLCQSDLEQGALECNIKKLKRRDRQRLFPVSSPVMTPSPSGWWRYTADNNNQHLQPELQIWRKTGGTMQQITDHFRIATTTVNNVAEYTLTTPRHWSSMRDQTYTGSIPT